MTRASWYLGEPALTRIMSRHLGASYAQARPRLERMGEGAANEGARWAQAADHEGPRLVTHDHCGNRIDEIEYHHSYRRLQELGYGGGIVAATHDPALAPERGQAPKSLTFGLGYLFAQAEAGMYCPICMTDGAAQLIEHFGTSELRERFVPRLASTELSSLYTGAMFLTEREGGSDVGQVRTVARGGNGAPGDLVTLHGHKWFCSNVDADAIMILARPDGAGPGTRGLGLYLLPRTLEDGRRNRFRIERIKDKLGERSFPTGEVTLEGAEAYLLGGAGEGFRQMATMLNLSRLYNAVASVAVMRRAVVEAISWCEQRTAFGKPVIHHPLMTEQLMDMVCEQRLALNWVFFGVGLMDKTETGTATGDDHRTLRLLTPLLKYWLGKRAMEVASEGVEALGGNGYIEDWPMARLLRDAQVLPIWEGTSNVLVLDSFRVIKKEAGQERLLTEIERGIAAAPDDLQPRLRELTDELKAALAELTLDPRGEHAFRDWSDRASLLWSVATSLSQAHGFGADTDLRAARRVLARRAPTSLLRTDRATADEVRAIAFQ